MGIGSQVIRMTYLPRYAINSTMKVEFFMLMSSFRTNAGVLSRQGIIRLFL